MSEGRKFPAEYDQWIVKAVGEISSFVWDLSAGALDVGGGASGPANLKKFADIIRRHSMDLLVEQKVELSSAAAGASSPAGRVQIVITLS